MQISPETQLFIREHQTDDVRALALQARKYPNVDMPTAITQIAGSKLPPKRFHHGEIRMIYGTRSTCHWSNVRQKSPPATKQPF